MDVFMSVFDYEDFDFTTKDYLFKPKIIAVAIVPIYLAVIGAIWLLVKFRGKPFDLSPVVFIHNAILSVLSAFMVVGMVLGIFRQARQFGAYSLWCVPSSWGEPQTSPDHMTSEMVLSGTLGYWMYIFYVSKLYELIDTVLSTLRGKPLTVLHVFHHAIMPFTARSWLERKFETCWIGAVMNATIHVVMYYFFARKTVDRAWDPYWKKYLTTMQIVQFIIICTIMYIFSVYSYHGLPWVQAIVDWDWQWSGTCSTPLSLILVSQSIDVAFLSLFINFFVQTYRAGAAAKKERSKTAAPAGRKPSKNQ